MVYNDIGACFYINCTDNCLRQTFCIWLVEPLGECVNGLEIKRKIVVIYYLVIKMWALVDIVVKVGLGQDYKIAKLS